MTIHHLCRRKATIDPELACPYLAVNGTPFCLEHAEPAGGASSYHGAYERIWPPMTADRPAPVSVPARPYVPELVPAPPTQRGWLRRAVEWVFR